MTTGQDSAQSTSIIRSKVIQRADICSGLVVYWMMRDQRVQDNWALLRAQELAKKYGGKLSVVFTLRTNLIKHAGTARWLDFMLAGLQDVEKELSQLGIPFTILLGDPPTSLQHFVEERQVSALVTDMSPLRVYRRWVQDVAQLTRIHIEMVDAHNIVPVWLASNKQEFAARTFRPKMYSLLPDYLIEFPKLQPMGSVTPTRSAWKQIRQKLHVDESITLPTWWKAGSHAARGILDDFIATKIENYSVLKNDPLSATISDLSPYLHFGQIAPQRVVLEMHQQAHPDHSIDFLEQLIVRRELADNYCWYNENYDQFTGFPDWSRATLNSHRSDHRTFIYRSDQFEHAQTHDHVWNAAQREMLHTGKMHGYLRMYWAKKILEWSDSPETALQIAISLNDRYSLDGRDPNGYVGIAWSIGGVHDRPWFNRPIFGLVRYMGESGLKKHFNTEEYCKKWSY